jgi:hypothetical protein
MQRFQENSSEPPVQKLSQLWALLLTLPKPIVLSREHAPEVIIADEPTGQEKLRFLERAEKMLTKRSFPISDQHKRN